MWPFLQRDEWEELDGRFEVPDYSDEYMPQMAIGHWAYGLPPTRRCWADSSKRGDDCGRPSTAPLGLCDQHYEELRVRPKSKGRKGSSPTGEGGAP